LNIHWTNDSFLRGLEKTTAGSKFFFFLIVFFTGCHAFVTIKRISTERVRVHHISSWKLPNRLMLTFDTKSVRIFVAFYCCWLDTNKVRYTYDYEIVMKWGAEVRTGLIWLAIGTRRGRLWRREINFQFPHKMWEISWLSDDLLTSQ